MQNFTKEESSALMYLKLARDLGANNISINKSTCEVIINLVERLIKKVNGGWISVADRLPNTKEHNKEYLCRCVLLDDDTEEYGYCLVLKWYLYDIIDGKTTIRPHFEEDGHNMKVTHWQPLPEMPKIEGEQ